MLRQAISLVRVANLEHGDILKVAHDPVICVPPDDIQHDGEPLGLSAGAPAVTPISALAALPLAPAAATASPSPSLLER